MEQENAPTMTTLSIEQHVEDDGERVKEKCIIVISVIMLTVIIYAIGAFHVFAYGNAFRKRL